MSKVSWFDGDANPYSKKCPAITANATYSTREKFSSSANIEYFNAGYEMNAHVFKVENENRTLTLQAGNLGADFGVKLGRNLPENGISAMLEASVVKAEATYGPLYVNLGLNANTGVKLGTDGCKASLLGFGLTFGVGGRWTFDSPFGSIGGSSSSIKMKNNENERKVRNQVLI